MNSDRRLHYMSAMGIESWLPHQVLPGAKLGRFASRQSFQAQAIDRSPHADGVNAGHHAATGQLSAIAEQFNSPTKTSALAQPFTSPVVADSSRSSASTVSSMASLPNAVQLSIVECPGKLLIIDQHAASQAQRALLENIAIALCSCNTQAVRFQPFSWSPGRNNGVETPVELLQGLLERVLEVNGASHVLLMGELVAQLLLTKGKGQEQEQEQKRESAAMGAGQLSEILGSRVKIVYTYSSSQLLQDSRLKVQSWQHMQDFVSKSHLTAH